MAEKIDAAADEEVPEKKVKSETKTEEDLSTAQRARIERNRLRARALRDARLVQRPPT